MATIKLTGAVGLGGGGGGGAATLPLANGSSQFDIATVSSDVTITAAGMQIWTFGADGTTTVPGTVNMADHSLANVAGVNFDPSDNTRYITTSGDSLGFGGLGLWYGEQAGVDINANTISVTTSPTGGGTAQTWAFGTDGNLTLPNANASVNMPDGTRFNGLAPHITVVDGNLAVATNLVMTKQGGAGFVSEVTGQGNYNVWFMGSTGDADGNTYSVGGNNDTDLPMVYSFDASGAVRWKVGLDNFNGNNPSSYNIVVSGTDVIVTFRYYDNNVGSAYIGMVYLDSATGSYNNSTVLDSPISSNPYPYGMATTAAGEPIIAGEMHGEFLTTPDVAAIAPSGVDALWVSSADIPTPVDPSNGQSWEIDISGAAKTGNWVNVNGYNFVDNCETVAVTGTGTGMKVYVSWNEVTNTYNYVSTGSILGSGYANGDTLRVLGSTLGGVDGVNDCDFQVYDNWYYGKPIAGGSGTGTIPPKSMFYTNSGTNFSVDGPYSIRMSLNSQAFIWTPNWQHTFGDAEYQYFRNTIADETTGEVYALGRFQKYIDNKWLATTLMKFDSSGNTLWSKYVESNDPNGSVGGVAVGTNGSIFVVTTDGGGSTVATKLDSNGDLVWQVRQDNGSNWNDQPGCSTDANGDLYISGSWYAGNNYVLSIMKLDGNDGTKLFARTLSNAENFDMYEHYDDDCQTFRVVGNNIYVGGYVYDINNNYYDGYSTKLPTDGTGMGTYGRWIYAVDGDASFSDTTDSAIIQANDYGVPVDAAAQTVSGNSEYVTADAVGNSTIVIIDSIGGISPNLIGASIIDAPSVGFADGTELTTAGVARASVDTGDNTITLTASQNGKFIYYSGNNGSSTIWVPSDNDVSLPIGYTVTIVMDNFNTNPIYVNNQTGSYNAIINATGFAYDITNSWKLGNTGKNGVYTLIKVDTDRWMLSGSDVTQN